MSGCSRLSGSGVLNFSLLSLLTNGAVGFKVARWQAG